MRDQGTVVLVWARRYEGMYGCTFDSRFTSGIIVVIVLALAIGSLVSSDFIISPRWCVFVYVN